MQLRGPVDEVTTTMTRTPATPFKIVRHLHWRSLSRYIVAFFCGLWCENLGMGHGNNGILLASKLVDWGTSRLHISTLTKLVPTTSGIASRNGVHLIHLRGTPFYSFGLSPCIDEACQVAFPAQNIMR